MNEYERICKLECEWCAKGLGHIQVGDAAAYHNFEFGVFAGLCTAPTIKQFCDRQASQIVGMQEALAKAECGYDCASGRCVCGLPPLEHGRGESIWSCRKLDNPNDVYCPGKCNCYLSTIPDAVARGKQLLEMERLVSELRQRWNDPASLHGESPMCMDIIQQLVKG